MTSWGEGRWISGASIKKKRRKKEIGSKDSYLPFKLQGVQGVREDKPNMGSSRNSYYFFKLYKWIFQCERISIHRPGLQSHMRTFY